MSSMRIPKELSKEINSLKLLPEEPSYKVIVRLIEAYRHGKRDTKEEASQ